jgi:hypothetical protein
MFVPISEVNSQALTDKKSNEPLFLARRVTLTKE